MDRKEKECFVSKMQDRLREEGALVVVRQKGLTVSEVTDLRVKIRAAEATYQVSKNTLARLAIKGTRYELLGDFLEGQTAFAFSNSPSTLAKVLFEYADKRAGKLEIVGGCYEGKLLSHEDLKMLSQLPSLDVLRAQIVAVVQAPMRHLATVIQAPIGQLARVFGAYADKG